METCRVVYASDVPVDVNMIVRKEESGDLKQVHYGADIAK